MCQHSGNGVCPMKKVFLAKREDNHKFLVQLKLIPKIHQYCQTKSVQGGFQAHWVIIWTLLSAKFIVSECFDAFLTVFRSNYWAKSPWQTSLVATNFMHLQKLTFTTALEHSLYFMVSGHVVVNCYIQYTQNSNLPISYQFQLRWNSKAIWTSDQQHQMIIEAQLMTCNFFDESPARQIAFQYYVQ